MFNILWLATCDFLFRSTTHLHYRLWSTSDSWVFWRWLMQRPPWKRCLLPPARLYILRFSTCAALPWDLLFSTCAALHPEISYFGGARFSPDILHVRGSTSWELAFARLYSPLQSTPWELARALIFVVLFVMFRFVYCCVNYSIICQMWSILQLHQLFCNI